MLTCTKHRVQKQNMTFSNIHGQLMVYELDTENKFSLFTTPQLKKNHSIFKETNKCDKNLLVVHCLQCDEIEFCLFLSPYNKHAVHFPCFRHCKYFN